MVKINKKLIAWVKIDFLNCWQLSSEFAIYFISSQLFACAWSWTTLTDLYSHCRRIFADDNSQMQWIFAHQKKTHRLPNNLVQYLAIIACLFSVFHLLSQFVHSWMAISYLYYLLHRIIQQTRFQNNWKYFPSEFFNYWSEVKMNK